MRISQTDYALSVASTSKDRSLRQLLQRIPCRSCRRLRSFDLAVSGRRGAQASTDDVEQITAVAQGDGAEFGEVAEDDGVALDRTAHAQVFQHLDDGADAVVGGDRPPLIATIATERNIFLLNSRRSNRRGNAKIRLT